MGACASPNTAVVVQQQQHELVSWSLLAGDSQPACCHAAMLLCKSVLSEPSACDLTMLLICLFHLKMQRPAAMASDRSGQATHSGPELPDSGDVAGGLRSTPGLPPGMVPTSALGIVAMAAEPPHAHPGAPPPANGAIPRISIPGGSSSGGTQARIDAIRQRLFAEHAGHASVAHTLLPASAGGTAAAVATHFNNAAGLAADGAWGPQAPLQHCVPSSSGRVPTSKPLQLQHLLSQPDGQHPVSLPPPFAMAAIGSGAGDTRQPPPQQQQQQAGELSGQQQTGQPHADHQQQQQQQQQSAKPGGSGGGGGRGASQPPGDPLVLHDEPSHTVSQQYPHYDEHCAEHMNTRTIELAVLMDAYPVKQMLSRPPDGCRSSRNHLTLSLHLVRDLLPLVSVFKPCLQVLRARDAPDAAYEVFCRTPGVPPTDLRVRVFPPDSLLIEVHAAAEDAQMTDHF